MSAPCAVCTLQLFSIGKRAFGANTISLRTTTVFGLFSWRHPVFPTELAKGRGIFVVSPWCMHWCSLGSLHAAMLQWTQPLFVWQGGRLGSKPWSLHMWAYWLCESTSQAFVYMALDLPAAIHVRHPKSFNRFKLNVDRKQTNTDLMLY